MAEVRGDLTVKVVKGINLQNNAVFGTCNPFILVKLKSSLESLTTSVKDGENNPSWQDTFTFRNASSTDELQISLMEKAGTMEGVVSVAEYLPSTAWGFPGMGGAERLMEVTMPGTPTRDASTMGTVVVLLRYRAELPLRAPFRLLATAAANTGKITDKAKIDVVLDKTLNMFYQPVVLVGAMTRRQKMASGGAAAMVGTGVSMTLMALAVPVLFLAMLFLPLTLTGGFFFVMTALAVLPFVLIVGWLILCSKPIQCRVWLPSLFWTINKFPILKKVILQPARA